MVKRYSHIAIVSGETGGGVVHGEYVPGTPFEMIVKGQYFPDNSGNQKKVNVHGKEFIVKGEFSTKHKKIDKATHIRIESIGLDVDIEYWEPFQTHSVIYI